MNLFFTWSKYHGLSQKRPRTFYFFTKSENAHVLPWYRREPEDIEVILEQKVADDDPMNIPLTTGSPTDNAWLSYCLAMTDSKTIKEYYDKITETTNCTVTADGTWGDLNKVADWMDDHNFSKAAGRARAMQKKLDAGLGYWGYGITVPKGSPIPALIGPTAGGMVNPFTEGYITIRDALRIMKMPDDFNLAGENPLSKANHIYQNVPATTAEDMMTSVIQFLDGHTDTSYSSFLLQDNVKHTIIDRTPATSNTQSLEIF